MTPPVWEPVKQRFLAIEEIEDEVAFPEDFFEWILTVRPEIDNKPYSFLPYPFWHHILDDEHHQLMAMAGRQVFKSTWFCNILAHLATTVKNSTGVYCSYDDESVSKFSYRYRQQTLNKHPLLRSVCSGKRTGMPGQVGKVLFENGSQTLIVSDESHFTHVEGSSPNVVCLDECQYLELEHLGIVYEALSTTMGKLRFAGIGGEAGSELERLWKQTTMSEWRFKDKYWRDKLHYDHTGRLVVEDYLTEVMDGRWIAQNKHNAEFPGYHLPQTIFPHIPATIANALERKLPIRFSIEYKQKNYPKALYIAHTLGGFYEAQRRPITEEMVRACMEPYSYLKLIPPEFASEVIELKNIFGKQIKILMGVDYGSGKAGRGATVPVIIIKWKRHHTAESRYQLVWIEERPPENPDDQAEYLANLHNIYGVDAGCGDLGYGADRVKKMQEGGYNRKIGTPWNGTGNLKFIGTRTIAREAQKLEFKERELDESGDVVQQIILDKTQVLDDFISFIQWYVPHPTFPDEEILSRPKLMIPYMYDQEVEWLIKDWTGLIRKDIEPEIDKAIEDERQHARKEYNHPADSLSAMCQALVADQQPEPSYEVGGIYTGPRGGARLK